MKKLLSMTVMLFTAINYLFASSGVYLNNTPAAETTEGNLYFSIEPGLPSALTGEFRLDSTKYASASLNGVEIKNTNNNFSVADWHADGANTLSLTDVKGEVTEWNLTFTSMPIVVVNGVTQAELYEHFKTGVTNEEEKLPCQIEILDPRHRTNKNLYYFASDARMRVRGATSAGKDKKSFAVDLLDSAGQSLDVRVLGLRKDDDWILDAMFNDPSRMRNRIITDLWTVADTLPYEVDNEYQRNGTMGEYVEVILSGEYWGLYCLTDKIDRKKLNLKKTKEATDSTAEEIRGLLWKSTFRCSATTFSKYEKAPTNDTLVWEEYWTQKYPDDRQDQARFQPLAEMIEALGMGDEQMFADSLESKLYINNLINYHIFTQSLQLMDNLQKNMYCSVKNVKKGKKVLITLWDLDASIGRTAGGDPMGADEIKWIAFGEQLGGINVLLWRLAFNNPNNYRQKLYNRWEELKKTTLSIDSIQKRMEIYGELFNTSGAWQREYSKWGRKMFSETIEKEISYMTDFLKANYLAMDKQMADWGLRDVPVDTTSTTPQDTTGGGGVIIAPEPISSIDFEKEGEPIHAVASINGMALEVVTMDADTFLYSFSTKPEITFANNKLIVKEGANVVEFEVAAVDYFAFRNVGVGPDDVRDVLSIVEDKDAKYTVFNTNGQILKNENDVLSLEGLPNGVYFVKYGQRISKVIKK